MAGLGPFLRAQAFETQSALNAHSGIKVNQNMPQILGLVGPLHGMALRVFSHSRTAGESYRRRISDAEQGRNTGNDRRTRKSRYSGLEAELLGDEGSCSKSGMLRGSSCRAVPHVHASRTTVVTAIAATRNYLSVGIWDS